MPWLPRDRRSAAAHLLLDTIGMYTNAPCTIRSSSGLQAGVPYRLAHGCDHSLCAMWARTRNGLTISEVVTWVCLVIFQREIARRLRQITSGTGVPGLNLHPFRQETGIFPIADDTVAGSLIAGMNTMLLN